MYHHRGAYLQALAMLGHTGLSAAGVHLWTLPMFHCNGWCVPSAVTAGAGTHVCMRKIDAAEIWRLIGEHGVTHLEAAPTVAGMLAYADEAVPAARPIRMCVGGAPPSPAILQRMAELQVDVTHLYGLTEILGPAAICDWRLEWDELDAAEQARKKARHAYRPVADGPQHRLVAHATVLEHDRRMLARERPVDGIHDALDTPTPSTRNNVTAAPMRATQRRGLATTARQIGAALGLASSQASRRGTARALPRTA